jgi:gliding motility-associated-like protein
MPEAAFHFTPASPVSLGTPVLFLNQSTGASSYWWDFGDQEQSVERDPSHAYIESTVYTVTLIAQSAQGCLDTSTSAIEVGSRGGKLYVPNAFSPNGDGINDRFSVKGNGIIEYRLQVFSRWGKLLFESIDPEMGWDGKYHGMDQGIGTYVYIVHASFQDGHDKFRKGNVTLIR